MPYFLNTKSHIVFFIFHFVLLYIFSLINSLVICIGELEIKTIAIIYNTYKEIGYGRRFKESLYRKKLDSCCWTCLKQVKFNYYPNLKIIWTRLLQHSPVQVYILDRHNVMPVSWSYPRPYVNFCEKKRPFTSFFCFCVFRVHFRVWFRILNVVTNPKCCYKS